MISELKKFIQENKDLINQNSKESWEEIYSKIPHKIAGEFTQTLLDADIDPAEIMRQIPNYYLQQSNIEHYKIHNSVTSIGYRAFAQCNLTSVEIPNRVASIGSFAFQDCSSLTSVEIPDSVTSIGPFAFDHCTNLTSVVIPSNVTSIGGWAFFYCSSLTSVVISSSVTTIGNSAFEGCENLKEIQYKGTKKDALTKLKVRNDENWRCSSIEKIICSDGVIEL